jgi:hypothetical protein
MVRDAVADPPCYPCHAAGQSPLATVPNAARIHQAEKMIGGNLFAGLHGRYSRERPKVANHVHLIMIVEGMGNLRPGLPSRLLHLQRFLEPRDPRHHLWRYTRTLQALSLELPKTQPGLSEHLPNSDGRTRHGQAVERSAERILHFHFMKPLQQKLIEKCHALFKRRRISQLLVPTGDTLPKYRVRFSTYLGQRSDGLSKQVVKALRRKQDHQRIEIGGNV